jgi:hypothetical protein
MLYYVIIMLTRSKVVPGKEYKKFNSKVTVQEICNVKSRTSAKCL